MNARLVGPVRAVIAAQDRDRVVSARAERPSPVTAAGYADRGQVLWCPAAPEVDERRQVSGRLVLQRGVHADRHHGGGIRRPARTWAAHRRARASTRPGPGRTATRCSAPATTRCAAAKGAWGDCVGPGGRLGVEDGGGSLLVGPVPGEGACGRGVPVVLEPAAFAAVPVLDEVLSVDGFLVVAVVAEQAADSGRGVVVVDDFAGAGAGGAVPVLDAPQAPPHVPAGYRAGQLPRRDQRAYPGALWGAGRRGVPGRPPAAGVLAEGRAADGASLVVGLDRQCPAGICSSGDSPGEGAVGRWWARRGRKCAGEDQAHEQTGCRPRRVHCVLVSARSPAGLAGA